MSGLDIGCVFSGSMYIGHILVLVGISLGLGHVSWSLLVWVLVSVIIGLGLVLFLIGMVLGLGWYESWSCLDLDLYGSWSWSVWVLVLLGLGWYGSLSCLSPSWY